MLNEELLAHLLASKTKKDSSGVWALLCFASVIVLIAVATYAYTGGALPTLPSFTAPAVVPTALPVASPQTAPQTAPQRVQVVPTVEVARPVDVPAVAQPVVPQAPVPSALPGRADEAAVQVAPLAAEAAQVGQAAGAGAWIK